MRYLILAACFLVAFAADRAFGGDWRFRRSYYTHEIPRELAQRYPYPPSRSAYRPAYISPYPGFTVQGGFRINRIQINSGSSSDSTYIYEGWFRQR